MSDWWAINTEGYENFDYGLDMNMPGGPGCCEKTGKDGSWWAKIPDWIKEGHTTEERVNDAARRIIAAMYKLGQLTDSTLTDNDLYPNYVDLDKTTISDDTKKLNREVGGESIVLLKNQGNFLPLTDDKLGNYASVKVFGNSAAESECLTKFDCTCKGDESSY
jgi:beta-glucosidase